MRDQETAVDPEADVVRKLAHAAAERGGPPLSLASVLPSIAFNFACLCASAWVGIGSMFGFLLKPYPWIAALQIGSAWVAVAMVWSFPRRYSLFHGVSGRLGRVPGEKRIFLYGYFFPVLFTLLHYYKYLSLLHRMPAVLMGCGVGAVLLAAAGYRDRPLWDSGIARFDLALALLISLGYGYATILQLNCILDRSSATVYESTVQAKHIYGRSSPFKRGTYLDVAPWGPEQGPGSAAVPINVTRSVQEGDRVCVVVRKGALGVSWYTIQLCPWNGGPLELEPGGRL